MRRLSLILLSLFACSDAPREAEPWDPTTIEATLPSVLEALRSGDPDAALAELTRLDQAGTLPEGATHYRALALADAGRAGEALAAFEQELENHPGNGHAHALLAELLIDSGRLQEADEHLVDARLYAPEHPMPKLLSGRLSLLLDEDEQAQRFFRDYLLLDPYGPRSIEAYAGLAQVSRQRGGENDPDALRFADTANALSQVHQYMSTYRDRLLRDPQDAQAADGMVRSYLSLHQSMGGDPRLLAEAEKAVVHILSIDPEDARALYNLGYIRIEQRRFDESIELTVRSLDADPDFAPARLNYAKLLQLRREYAQAVTEYERVIATAQKSSERARAHFELVQYFNSTSSLAERARALPHARALVVIEPSDPFEAQELIDELEAELEGEPSPPEDG
jgi:tetratricopeptide (TPR) repeat protein